jgi:hypothetical protein
MQDMAQEFFRKVDAGLPHRRFLEEIGKLSCDELAVVLLAWHKGRSGTNKVSQAAQPD